MQNISGYNILVIEIQITILIYVYIKRIYLLIKSSSINQISLAGRLVPQFIQNSEFIWLRSPQAGQVLGGSVILGVVCVSISFGWSEFRDAGNKNKMTFAWSSAACLNAPKIDYINEYIDPSNMG